MWLYFKKRGKNKGCQCGKNCVLGYGYCKLHLEKMKSKHKNLIPDLRLCQHQTISNKTNKMVYKVQVNV